MRFAVGDGFFHVATVAESEGEVAHVPVFVLYFAKNRIKYFVENLSEFF